MDWAGYKLKFTQFYPQLIAQLVLMVLHVSVANCQGAASAKDMYSMLYRLSNINCNNIYIY